MLDILRYNSGRRFSIRELQKKLGYGDRRTISVCMQALVAYKGIKVDRIYGHIVYYYPKKKKR